MPLSSSLSLQAAHCAGGQQDGPAHAAGGDARDGQEAGQRVERHVCGVLGKAERGERTSECRPLGAVEATPGQRHVCCLEAKCSCIPSLLHLLINPFAPPPGCRRCLSENFTGDREEFWLTGGIRVHNHLTTIALVCTYNQILFVACGVYYTLACTLL